MISTRVVSIISIKKISRPKKKFYRFFFICFVIIFNNDTTAQETTKTISSIDAYPQSKLRIEPPFWWTGMENKQLQLMIHQKDIAQYDFISSNKYVVVNSVERTDNSNYLFVNLTIDSKANSALYYFDLQKKGKSYGSIKYFLKKRRTNSARRKGFDSSDVMYLVNPDRFSNGDYTNDSVTGLIEGIDRRNINGRHGGDIQGIIDHLGYIYNMGFTQLWATPMLENNNAKYSYHGYGITDHYRIDPRFGSNALYFLLSNKAKEIDIGLIKDSVLNHISINHWWVKDMPAKNWFNHGRIFVPTSHKRESLHDKHGTLEDREAFTDGWFVPTMIDLNQRNSLVANYLIQNNIWWIEAANLSGIRIDTFSYSDKGFLSEYTRRLMDEYPNFNLVAEEWSINPIIVSYWQKGKQRHDKFDFQLPSLMDFPLQDALVRSLKEKESWSDGLQKLYDNIATDFIYANAGSLVVFADNHDMSRIFTQFNQDVALTKIAIAFLATTRGIPQLYYGTELLMENPNSDSHGEIRSDFPGGWSNDNINAITGKGLSKQQKDMQQWIKRLLNWRKNSPVMKGSKLVHYVPKNGVYVYFRYNDFGKIMVVINKNNQAIKIDPKNYPSMLSSQDRKLNAREILLRKNISLDKPFIITEKSAYILQLDSPHRTNFFIGTDKYDNK